MYILKIKLMMRYFAAVLLIVSLCSCVSRSQNASNSGEDLEAKKLFQGIWLDDETESPLLKIEGDTIYYSDSQSASVYFEIVQDSLYMYGNEVSHYKIDKQDKYSFWFHSLADNIIKLHKSENANDNLVFSNVMEVIPPYAQVTEKDTVIMYEGVRYRAYVYVNPSTVKVVKTTISEEGISIDNEFYDNVMHICVYEGRKSRYASDITKKNFVGIVPDDFLNKCILSDMSFLKVDASGFHYQATLNIPESPLCYLVNLNVDFQGKLSTTLL